MCLQCMTSFLLVLYDALSLCLSFSHAFSHPLIMFTFYVVRSFGFVIE